MYPRCRISISQKRQASGRIIVGQLYPAVEVQFSRQVSFDTTNLPGWCLDVPRHRRRQSEHKQ